MTEGNKQWLRGFAWGSLPWWAVFTINKYFDYEDGLRAGQWLRAHLGL